MNVKYLEDCLYSCFDTSSRKMTRYYSWKKLKLYEKHPISKQFFSAMKSNKQLAVNVKERIMSTSFFYWTKISTPTMST